MQLVLIHGAPGVGKLTVARELAKLTGYPVFHNHMVINMLAELMPSNSPSYLKLREQLWLAVIQAASRDRLPGLIFTFVYESSTLPGFFTRLQESLRPDDELLPIELRCELDENERRLMQPERLALWKFSSRQYLREWVLGGGYMSPEGLPGNMLIDNTDLAAPDTAQRIFRHITVAPGATRDP